MGSKLLRQQHKCDDAGKKPSTSILFDMGNVGKRHSAGMICENKLQLVSLSLFCYAFPVASDALCVSVSHTWMEEPRRRAWECTLAPPYLWPLWRLCVKS